MLEEERITLRDELEPVRANEIMALLGALGFDVVLHTRNDGRCRVLVAVREADAASRALDAEPQEKRLAKRLDEGTASVQAVWFGRGWEALLLVAIVCVAVFWSAHLDDPTGARDRLLRHGAISPSRVASGETWRLLTAIFLHFDVMHLTANLLSMLLVAPPLANMLGAARFLLVFVLSGIAGNVASQVLAPTGGLKAGASGALAGVLGALAGQALRPNARTRFRAWQILGALAAVYALLVGAGPQSDHIAHAGGLVAGVVLGRLLRDGPRSEDLVTRGER